MTPAQIVYAVLLLLWLILTLVHNLPTRLTERIATWDLLALVPLWRFFAPTPGRHDWVIVSRLQYPDGTFTHWKEVLICPTGALPKYVVNPARKLRKATFDLVGAFQREMVGGSQPHNVQLSLPYLVWLNVASRPWPRAPQCRVQFAVVGFEGLPSENAASCILMISNFHRQS